MFVKSITLLVARALGSIIGVHERVNHSEKEFAHGGIHV
ncbi:hypothetical protein ADU37_CDS14480 [Thermococcus sp. 2319x1]|nr:hypothetical protein ADU37_CDS14480 [Thermococcus sp. 2319x1]